MQCSTVPIALPHMLQAARGKVLPNGITDTKLNAEWAAGKRSSHNHEPINGHTAPPSQGYVPSQIYLYTMRSKRSFIVISPDFPSCILSAPQRSFGHR